MAEALQKAPAARGKVVKKKVTGDVTPNDASVNHLTLKNGMLLTVVYDNKGGSTITAKSGLSKISDVKSSLSKLIEMIATTDVPSDTLDAMLNEVTENATRRQPRGGALTKNQADVLIRSGALSAERLADLEKRVDSGELARIERETRLGAISRALTAEQVGKRLGGLSASRVRHRQNDNLLYAFLAGKSRRYPLWQFIDDQVVPGLTEVIPHFIDGWQPATVEGFMTTPQADLHSGLADPASEDEGRMTPVEWLAGGGDPAAVVEILERIART